MTFAAAADDTQQRLPRLAGQNKICQVRTQLTDSGDLMRAEELF